MAWAALIAGLIYPVLLLITDSNQFGAVAGPFYIFVGAVVGAYVGFATLDDRWKHEYRYDQLPVAGEDIGHDRTYSGGKS